MPSDGDKVEPMERLAERELCESPRAKSQAIDFMKDWIRKNNHIINVRTGEIINRLCMKVLKVRIDFIFFMFFFRRSFPFEVLAR